MEVSGQHHVPAALSAARDTMKYESEKKNRKSDEKRRRTNGGERRGDEERTRQKRGQD
jgi:hypothetical protein